MTTSLSVDAITFVPKSKSLQHRPVESSLSADVPEFVPFSQNQIKQQKSRGRFSRRKDENLYFQERNAGRGHQPEVKQQNVSSQRSDFKSIQHDEKPVKKQVASIVHKEATVNSKGGDFHKIGKNIRDKKSSDQKEEKVEQTIMSWSSIVKQPPINKNLPVYKTNNEKPTKNNSVKMKKSYQEKQKLTVSNSLLNDKTFVGKTPCIASTISSISIKKKENLPVHASNDVHLNSSNENPIKYTKRKLTRTMASFLSSSGSIRHLNANTVEGEQVDGIKQERRTDFLSMKKLIYSYKSNIEQGRDVYKVTKSKHKLLQKIESSPEAPSEETSTVPENVIPKSSSATEKVLPTSHEAFPLLGDKEVVVLKHAPSYSAAVKKVFQKPTSLTKTDENPGGAQEELSEEEIRSLKKKQKALNRKMKIKRKKEEKRKELEEERGGVVEPQPVKQSQKDIKLNISDMFGQLLISQPKQQRNSQRQKKIAISTGVISVVSGLAKKNTPDGRKLQRKKIEKGQTILDGTTLIRKRGKERETPKKKKPTLLKKIIKAERERKRKLLEKQSLVKIKTSEATEITEPLTEKDEDSAETVPSNYFNMNPDNMNPDNMNPDNMNPDKDMNNKDKVRRVSSLNDLPTEVYQKLHSRKFREYCNHVLSKDINNLTQNLLTDLQKYQDRVYHENPIKYKQKRRFVLGLREVLKHMKVKKIKAVVIAPNLERISSRGGLDDYLSSILSLCKEHEIPQIFAMNRHALGRTLKKKAPVSIVGIFNYDGAQEIFKQLLESVHTAQKDYNDKVTAFLEKEYGHIPDISLTVESDMTLDENQTENSSCTVYTTTDADLIKQDIMNKFTVDEFRIVGDEVEQP